MNHGSGENTAGSKSEDTIKSQAFLTSRGGKRGLVTRVLSDLKATPEYQFLVAH